MTMPGPVAATERERKLWLWTGGALVVAALLGGVLVYRNVRATQGEETAATAEQSTGSETSEKDRARGAAREQAATPPPTPAELPAPQAAQQLADAGRPLSNKVRVVFKTFPSTRASVTWGKQRLGFVNPRAPLVIERPRDSGPMDVVVRAPGFLPVHTRAYTFDDSVVEVRLTTYAKKDTLYGYRQPLPPSDGGVTSAPPQ
jgi:hypothetical protein